MLGSSQLVVGSRLPPSHRHRSAHKTAVMPPTGDDADDTGYDPDDIHLGHALSKKFRASYVAEDGEILGLLPCNVEVHARDERWAEK